VGPVGGGKVKRMPARYTIRRFRMPDLDRVMELERASFGSDAYDRRLFAEYFEKCGELFLVASRGRKLSGYIVTCARGDRAELVSVAVDPAVRRTGAASALLDSTLRRLKLRGVRRFTLMVRVSNRRGRAFYEKYGFEKTRLVRDYYRNGAAAIRMAKLL
jgi:ribosomal-protein-alanine N-acetyltransferase